MLRERVKSANGWALILWSGVLSPFELVLLGRGMEGSGRAATLLKLWRKMQPASRCLAAARNQLSEVLLPMC